MKGAIFDLDGTLVDSMNYWSKNYIKKLDEENISYAKDVMDIVTPMGIRNAIKYMINLGSKKDENTLYNEIQQAMVNDYLNSIPAKEYTLEYVKKLYEQGIKICVLSASSPKMIDVSVKKCGFSQYLEFTTSCDELGMAKSQPEIFTFVADKLGVDIGDIVVFDDNPTAIKTAKISGAQTCAVYDSSNDKFTDEIKSSADAFIYSFKELL